MTPTAIVAAIETDPPALACFEVGGIDPRLGPPVLEGRVRRAFTRLSISATKQLIWLFDPLLAAIALTRSSTDLAETTVDEGFWITGADAFSAPSSAVLGSSGSS